MTVTQGSLGGEAYMAVGGLRGSLCGINGKLVQGRKMQAVVDGIV